jgi:hypothetical protein
MCTICFLLAIDTRIVKPYEERNSGGGSRLSDRKGEFGENEGMSEEDCQTLQ